MNEDALETSSTAGSSWGLTPNGAAGHPTGKVRPVKRSVSMVVFFTLAAGSLLLAPYFGMRNFSPEFALGEAADIFWQIRVPRVVLAFVAGSALALGGMIFQALFRNDLATPFTLGVSSGAALGASLALRLGLTFSIGWLSGTTLCAFAGA